MAPLGLLGTMVRAGIIAPLRPDKYLRIAAVVSREGLSVTSGFAISAQRCPNRPALIDELGIRGRVRMLGRRDDMPAVYASLDLMVSSSRREGLPMAILEGMASRLPLIATAVGGVPTVVLDGRTGVLVPAEDPAALATGIIELLRDDAQRERLGSAARQLVEDEFSAQRMTADYLRVYEAAVAKAAKRRGRWGKSSVDPRGNTQ